MCIRDSLYSLTWLCKLVFPYCSIANNFWTINQFCQIRTLIRNMSCKLPLLSFNLSCKHFRSSRSSFCSRRLNDFKFLKIITLSLNLKVIFNSWISGVKLCCRCFSFTLFHHLYIALLVSLCIVLKLNCIS